MKYEQYAHELKLLLSDDQRAKRAAGRRYFLGAEGRLPRSREVAAATARTRRCREILSALGEPRISLVGEEGVRALVVLASHGDFALMKLMLAKIDELVRADPADTVPSLLPALHDFIAVVERRPQTYGTIWLFDTQRDPIWPYLYPVENEEKLALKRTEFGLGALHWPKSLAIPETQQPWLAEPLSSAVTRWPTPSEYAELVAWIPGPQSADLPLAG